MIPVACFFFPLQLGGLLLSSDVTFDPCASDTFSVPNVLLELLDSLESSSCWNGIFISSKLVSRVLIRCTRFGNLYNY